MARDGNGDGIGGAGPGDGTHGLGTADFLGNLRVAQRRAGGDFAQRLPGALLESGAAYVEREGGLELRIFHAGDDFREVVIAASQPGFGKSPLQFGD
jgi:hypothetical protein